MRKFIIGVKNLIRWFPIIWKDRDHDYSYTMEILKKKLLFSAESMNKHSYHSNKEKYVEQMQSAAVLLHVVQNETYMDELIDKKDATDQDLHNAILKQEEAKERLFNILKENIEHWWY